MDAPERISSLGPRCWAQKSFPDKFVEKNFWKEFYS